MHVGTCTIEKFGLGSRKSKKVYRSVSFAYRSNIIALFYSNLGVSFSRKKGRICVPCMWVPVRLKILVKFGFSDLENQKRFTDRSVLHVGQLLLYFSMVIWGPSLTWEIQILYPMNVETCTTQVQEL